MNFQSNQAFVPSGTAQQWSSCSSAGVKRLTGILLVSLLLSSCSGSHSGGQDPVSNPETELGAANPSDDDPQQPVEINLEGDTLIPPPAPELNITAGSGTLNFSWMDAPAGSSVSLEEYNRSTRETRPVVEKFESGVTTYQLPVSVLTFDWQNIQYILSVCTESDCLRSYAQPVDHLRDRLSLMLHIEDASEFDLFASAINTTSNARLVASGSPGRDVPDPFTNEPVVDAGSVTLFFEVEGLWWHGATLTAEDPQYNTQFGSAIGLDQFGDTVVVGAPYASGASGAVYVFERAGETWVQTQKLTPANNHAMARFGTSIAVSEDARTIVVGASGDANPSETQSTDMDEYSSPDAGAAHIFRFDSASNDWLETGYIRSDGISANALFGARVSVDATAGTLVVSAPGEVVDSTSTGALYIFDISQNDARLSQKLTRNAVSGTLDLGPGFALSANGSTLASSSRSLPPIGVSRVTDLRKPQTHINVYQKDDSGMFIDQATLTPAGVHGYESNAALSISDNGEMLATAISNEDSAGNSVTLYQMQSGSWESTNIFENPSAQTNEYGAKIKLSGEGSLLMVSAATESLNSASNNPGLDEPSTAESGNENTGESETNAAGAMYLY